MQKKSLFMFGLLANLLATGIAWAVHEPGHVSHGSEFAISSADNKYKLGFGGLLQEDNKFTYNKEAAEASYGLSMTLPAARINVHGNAIDPSLTYWFQAEFGKQNTGLLDYYVDKEFHNRWVHARVGKFSTPFSRPYLISPAASQFGHAPNINDNGAFNIANANRDIGIMVHNGTRHEVEYALAVQGEGVTGRVGFNHGNIDGYNPTDFAGGDLRFGVGLSAHFPMVYLKNEFNTFRGAADVIVKYRGFSSNGVFYYLRDLKTSNDKEKNILAAGADFGYLIKERYEPVIRYSWLPSADKSVQEFVVGVNHYVVGNYLKAHAYVGTKVKEAKFDNLEAGIQLQIAL